MLAAADAAVCATAHVKNASQQCSVHSDCTGFVGLDACRSGLSRPPAVTEIVMVGVVMTRSGYTVSFGTRGATASRTAAAIMLFADVNMARKVVLGSVILHPIRAVGPRHMLGAGCYGLNG
jgi:hypothetical protein